MIPGERQCGIWTELVFPDRPRSRITGHKTDAVYNRYRIVSGQDIREGMMQAEQYLKSQNLGHKTDK